MSLSKNDEEEANGEGRVFVVTVLDEDNNRSSVFVTAGAEELDPAMLELEVPVTGMSDVRALKFGALDEELKSTVKFGDEGAVSEDENDLLEPPEALAFLVRGRRSIQRTLGK